MIDPSTSRIAVIGGGLMGHGIAQEFAQAGFSVSVYEKDPERRNAILGAIEENLSLLAEKDILTEEKVRAVLPRIVVADSLASAVTGARLVVEAVFEDLELKKSIFRQFDGFCPKDVILASNSSSFTPSQYGRDARHPERILGTHYFNPPYLVPLVEVIKGKATSPEVLENVVALLKGMGKKVALVRKESPGFIANRIQIALFREAFNVVEQGIATPEEVDLAIKNSFGRRLGIMGPFEQCDIIGADLKLAIYEALIPHISHSPTPIPLLKKNIEAQKLGMKTGEGFYRWTPESIAAMHKKLRAWLAGINRLEGSLTSAPEERQPEDEGHHGKQGTGRDGR